MTIITQTNDTDFLDVIEQGLNADHLRKIGENRMPMHFCLEQDGVVKGGMKAFYLGTHFFVSWLYVDDALRGQGWGTKLMAAAEEKATAIGCRKMMLDTMSFQAPGFYQNLGFSIIATVPDFYDGHDRIFLQKEI